MIVDSYLLSLELRVLSPATVYGRRRGLARFAAWNLNHQRDAPTDVDEHVVHQYQVHLHHHITKNGTRLAVRSRQQYLIAVRGLYAWMRKTGHIDKDPAIDLELPKAPEQLPHHFLTVEDAELVLAQPDLTTTLGQRDRAMLEVLYATGVRRTELGHIHLDDVNLERRSLLIQHGKGARDRLIPTGQRAANRITDYLTNTRPQLVARNPNEATMFVTRAGNNICSAHIGSITAKYLRQAGITSGNCHTFRHTMATLMLHGGADLRSIQAMLGHRNLASTERYTHINIGYLTQVHSATHPGAAPTEHETDDSACSGNRGLAMRAEVEDS